VTNIVLDHRHAAELALKHLKDLGHTEIAFFRGYEHSADAEHRWNAINEVAGELGMKIDAELVVRLNSTDPTPNLGYPFGKELLARDRRFTALLAYNDISAIGAIRAFQEASLRVPEDISVVGFDDVPAAQFNNPSLTTIRQPLHRMGELAVEVLIARIEETGESRSEVPVQPEIVIRESTGPASNRAR
jgi:LacI family transcriptional regulator